MSADANVFRWAIRRFFSKTELDAGALDARYFAESEFIATSAGAGDAGKPVKLDAAGHIDATMINDADVDHGGLGGLSDDDHTGYALLAGRAGGSTLYGGTAANDDLTVHGTSHATRTTSYVLLQPTAGYVGIGTSTPTAPLHIAGATNTQLIIGYPDSASGYGELQFRDQTSGNVKWGIGANADSAASSNLFYLFQYRSAAEATVNAYRLLIDDNGKVGIGATPTSDLLTVGGTINANALTVATVPVATTTDTQSLSNKTLTSPTITSPTIGCPTIGGNDFTNATHAHQGASSGGTLDHGAALTGLGDDDHTQYALLAGRSGGSTLYGGTAANDDLTLHGTSNATRTSSYVIVQPSGGQMVVGASAPLTAWLFEAVQNGMSIALNPGYLSTTNYISSYNSGGTVPLAFFGSRVFVDGNQFGIGTSKTPTGTADSSGTTGDFGWDASYIYVKTSAGWKRSALSTF